MRKVVGLVAMLLFPIAVVIVAFQCARAFIEDAIR